MVIIMNSCLYHSGVKGMKWGIRKDSKRTASLRQQYRSEKDSYKKELLKAKYQDSKIRDTNRAATNYYKRTNDSSKGLKEASILENKYNADRLLYGNRSLY